MLSLFAEDAALVGLTGDAHEGRDAIAAFLRQSCLFRAKRRAGDAMADVGAGKATECQAWECRFPAAGGHQGGDVRGVHVITESPCATARSRGSRATYRKSQGCEPRL
jgi:hypothetical protein